MDPRTLKSADRLLPHAARHATAPGHDPADHAVRKGSGARATHPQGGKAEHATSPRTGRKLGSGLKADH